MLTRFPLFWEVIMIKYIAPMLAVAAAAFVSPSIGGAQDAPPTYVGAPGVYKLILDSERFRVIRAVWRPGQLDAPHSHPIPSAILPLTGCTLKLTSPEGTRIVHTKAGQPAEIPVTFGHTAQNITHHTCAAVFFERK
jgi:beta-alanine degradation protein BauB